MHRWIEKTKIGNNLQIFLIYATTPLENVKNLIRHDKGKTLKVIEKTLEELGYNVFHKVLNASDFGVPTARQRVYILGF